ncbi:MAG: NifB/NifX family molybdenum-iron cluster-binding protein [Xanthomonadales bacterium]|jgi:predicted Fe-Mo cluster-binding NifX family protein|nr:NifB/NifX family molybdenum-iron cluster-binding protein [Xanthomonadales bacterium]
MKRTFAIPTMDGKACAHFGHCQSFAVIEVNDRQLGEVKFLIPPAHQPGAYPRFLAEQGVDVILAGGMGAKAQQHFRDNNITVHMGIGADEPASLVEQFLRGELKTGANVCNHGTHRHERNCGN